MTPGPLDGKHGLPHPPLQKGGEGCKVKSRSSPITSIWARARGILTRLHPLGMLHNSTKGHSPTEAMGKTL
jgi:hypothetical protein